MAQEVPIMFKIVATTSAKSERKMYFSSIYSRTLIDLGHEQSTQVIQFGSENQLLQNKDKIVD